MTESKPPDKIYLQWHGDCDEPELENKTPCDEDVTWSRDRVFDLDFAYVRQDSEAVEALEQIKWIACLKRDNFFDDAVDKSLIRATVKQALAKMEEKP